MNITQAFPRWRIFLLSGWLAGACQLFMIAPLVTADDQLPAGVAEAKPELLAVPRDELALAGGAIRFPVPQGWFVSEVPVGRHLQIWVTPEPLAPRGLHEGVSVSFRWLGRPASDAELQSWAFGTTDALSRVAQSAQTVERRKIAGWPAVIISFGNDQRTVEHFVVGLETGVFELVNTAAPARFVAQQKATSQILAGLRLKSPQLPRRPANPEVAVAAEAIGLWKSLRGQLYLGEDGSVHLRHDRRAGYRLDQAGFLRFGEPREAIDGVYRAKNDLLLVTWNDGSRTIFRWRTKDGQLLLTDHHGRVSQLNRLLE